ncbi:MAG: branched-chain amino acid ABC transporter permease [Candidatus Margulisbacteria bacterium]|nr:branched-chain amino acid ABC transporter permease [Candidatus Margulisiibacteriota bacterium]
MDNGFLFHIQVTELLQHFVNGLSIGSIYALIALGYTLVYGILKFINFAHGDILMMGTYAGLFIYNAYRPPEQGFLTIVIFLLAMIGAMITSSVLGVIVEKLAYKPLRKAPRLAPLLSAIGVSIILMNSAALFFGTKSRKFDYPFKNDPLNIAGTTITPNQLLIIFTALIIMTGLHIFIKYSRLGKAMRATSENPTSAALMGINVDYIISITFVIGSALAAIAGILISMEYTVYPTMGTLIGLKAFIAAVTGGIGNIYGAMFGGIILGLLETFGVVILGIPYGLKDSIAFSLLIIILLFKPQGLLGKITREKI